MKNWFSLAAAWLAFATLSFSQPMDPGRSDLDPVYGPFYHGVASGDPLTDRVILWTRVTWDTTGPVLVNWKIATDTNLINVVNSGIVTTDETKDYTVKVDASGLQPGTWYYYGFEWIGRKSLVGRTKTAPAGDLDSARFAVVSCANYQTGFFNVYERLVARNDLDAVLMVGDYIYEYEVGGFGYVAGAGRDHEPNTEITDLSDYRTRHSQYKLDHDLRLAHQQYPFICIWDDHESANNSWSGGADNHQSGEGDWNTRKSEAIQAYMEWMPVRLPDPGNPQRIHREIPWGNLANFVLLDTRLEGRDEQVALPTDPMIDDTSRHIISPSQMDWLKNELNDTTTQWKIVTQQVMVAPLVILGLPFNTDQWDGYTADRRKLLDHIMGNQVDNVVVLTGDIHTSWGNDIPHPDSSYNSGTGAGSVAVEFVSPSITSPNTPFPIPVGLIQLANSHIKYADLTEHGFTILDINKTRTQCDWHFVPSINPPAYSDNRDDSWYVNAGERWLEHATSGVAPPATYQDLAPLLPDNPPLTYRDNGVIRPKELVVLSVRPNPFRDRFVVEYYQQTAGASDLLILDHWGRTLKSFQTAVMPAGYHLAEIDLGFEYSPGVYYVYLLKEGDGVLRRLLKVE